MILLRLLNPQGIAGLAASLALVILLLVQKVETRHWKNQSSQFEQLYAGQRAALDETVADYRAAADAARSADRANAERVAADQRAINQRTADDYQTRIADVRARSAASAGGMRKTAEGPADSGIGGSAPMPGLPASAGRAPQASGEDRLPAEDALTATEQAIQLDDLINWVARQAEVGPGAQSGSTAKAVPR
jgi:hypothetical protein